MSLLLYFRLPHDASLGAVEVSMDATVSDLVAAVREAASLDRAQIAFRGEPLGAGSEALADIGLCPESVIDVSASERLRIGRRADGISVLDDEQTIATDHLAWPGEQGIAVAASGWVSGTHTWFVDVVKSRAGKCYDFGVCTEDVCVTTCPLHTKNGVYCVRAFHAGTGNSCDHPAVFDAEGEWPEELKGSRIKFVLDCDAHTLLVQPAAGVQVTVSRLPHVPLHPCVGVQHCPVRLRMHNDPSSPLP
eukprot:TRINITY_DN3833_c0_g1_i1.p1 TRINITY_DN3833_c0_g1~~TRINITY_DN3833_c0_g1_i1.p1  ORF type:complete len:248 (+),score=40.38 TRINITY_DN3833_c0_g1_i1:3-746(+)